MLRFLQDMQVDRKVLVPVACGATGKTINVKIKPILPLQAKHLLQSVRLQFR